MNNNVPHREKALNDVFGLTGENGLYAVTEKIALEIKREHKTTRDMYKINRLTGELIELCKDIMTYNSKKAIRDYKMYKMSYEEILEDALSICLWDSLMKYDADYNVNFLDFWHVNVINLARTNSRKTFSEKQKFNDEAELNRDIQEMNNTQEYGSIFDNIPNDADEYTRVELRADLLKLIEKFERVEPLGRLMYTEFLTNEDERKRAILHILGATEYGAKERKRVQRIRDKFSTFVKANDYI